jgi:hypothetical protein
MAAIKITFETDEEAVWFWELCKKLGLQKLEVGFANNIPVPVYTDTQGTD